MLKFCRQPTHNLCALIATSSKSSWSRFYGKNNDSSDDEENNKKHNKPKLDDTEDTPKEEPASVRLNRLLASMKTDEPLSVGGLARPSSAQSRRKTIAKQATEMNDIITAAKNVASVLGTSEEVKQQTESELLSRLLRQNNINTKKNEAASGGDAESQDQELNLSELIVGMKIDRRQRPQEETRGNYVRRILSAKGITQPRGQQQHRSTIKGVKREPESYSGSVNLFGGQPLGIFTQPETLRDSPDICETWAELQKNELQLLVQRPPSNYYEKMALWTSQGKVWKFPINNEQDMQEEENVDFSEHIFLEQHLEPWCPNKGPIRHFMELVCVGLSKNPYITAQDKKEHIFWYRDYFEAKRDILKDLMSNEKMDKAIKQLADKA